MKKRILLTLLALVTTAKLPAQFAVAVVADPWHALWWGATELPKWIEVIDNTKKQIDKAKEMIDIVGKPGDYANSILADVAPTFAASDIAAGMSTVGEVMDLTRSGWSLYRNAVSLRRDVLAVPEKFSLFGNDVARDRLRYVAMAAEKALRARLQDAVEKKREVDKKEYEYQRKALERMRNTKTQSEMELLQANLAASKQRMDLAAERVRQSEVELSAYTQDAELERRKEAELAKEVSETVAQKLGERATAAMNVGGGPLDSRPAPFHYRDRR